MNVFDNRRWDSDIRTLSTVLEQGLIGQLWRGESRFDLNNPETLDAGPSSRHRRVRMRGK